MDILIAVIFLKLVMQLSFIMPLFVKWILLSQTTVLKTETEPELLSRPSISFMVATNFTRVTVYIKVIGIRPMAPVLSRGPLEGI